jgi:N-acetylglutamate synthase
MVIVLNQLEIRTLDIEDYELVINLWKKTEGIGLSDADSKENIERFLQRNPGLSLVALKDSELIGAVLCGHDGRRGYLHHLAIRKDQRFKGLGKKLVRCCLQKLKEEGIDKCHIFVFRENVQGIEFWLNNEWQKRLDLHILSRNIV